MTATTLRCQYSHYSQCTSDATHIFSEDPAFAFCDEHWPAAHQILDLTRCQRMRDKLEPRVVPVAESHLPEWPGQVFCSAGHDQYRFASTRRIHGGIYTNGCKECARIRRNAERGAA